MPEQFFKMVMLLPCGPLNLSCHIHKDVQWWGHTTTEKWMNVCRTKTKQEKGYSNKFDLLWGESQLWLPYVRLGGKT